MTLPQEMFQSIRNARHFMVALMDPSQTPKVPKAVRQRARDRLKHFPSEYEINELEKMHSLMGRDPNILLNECMKDLDSIRGELTIVNKRVNDVGNGIIETIKNTARS